MKRQYTATVYIFYKEKVLLHFHAKLGKWLPAGGHVEENETPPEAARREALEETGLDISFLTDDPLLLDAPHAKTLERPFFCLLENIPERKGESAHQHIDFIYLAEPKTTPPDVLMGGFRWFGKEELNEIEKDLFLDTKGLLEGIFTSGGVAALLFRKKLQFYGTSWPLDLRKTKSQKQMQVQELLK